MSMDGNKANSGGVRARVKAKLNERSEPKSQRQLKVGKEILQILLQGLTEGRFHSTNLRRTDVNFTKVDAAPDLKEARVYFSPYIKSEEEIFQELEKAKWEMQQLIAKKIRMKFTPRLHFYYDKGDKNAQLIDELIRSDKKSSGASSNSSSSASSGASSSDDE